MYLLSKLLVRYRTISWLFMHMHTLKTCTLILLTEGRVVTTQRSLKTGTRAQIASETRGSRRFSEKEHRCSLEFSVFYRFIGW